jgi:DNA-binding LacI/PurR family transcriptional regulator
MTTIPKLSSLDLARVALAACVDPRTVRRRLAGERQSCHTIERVDRALRECGFTPPEAPVSASSASKPTAA